jgi:hypothetical protein
MEAALHAALRPTAHEFNLMAVAVNEHLAESRVDRLVPKSSAPSPPEARSPLPQRVMVPVRRHARFVVLMGPVTLALRARPAADGIAHLDVQTADVTTRAVAMLGLGCHVVYSSPLCKSPTLKRWAVSPPGRRIRVLIKFCEASD